MASAKNIGRVSGLAVALGIGAVLAANPGVAAAETGDTDTQAASDSDTSTTSAAESDTTGADDADRPLSRFIRTLTTPRSESGDSESESDDESPRRLGVRWTPRNDADETEADADTDAEEADLDVTEPTPVDVEPTGADAPLALEDDVLDDDAAEPTSPRRPVFSETAVVREVQRLFGVLTPETAEDDTEPEAPASPAPVLGLALTTLARRPDTAPVEDVAPPAISVAAAEAHDPNPFRDEPVDAAIPELVRNVMEGVQGVLPDELDPIARESFEAVFRVSQMVPWVNFPVPALTIASLLQSALAGDKQATQNIVEQLVITIPVAGVAYWGADQLADTLNYEAEGAALKRQAIDLVWDTIDFPHLLHP